MTNAVAELINVGKRSRSMPVGVMIRVAKREDLALAARLADEMLAFARARLIKAAQPAALRARDARIAELVPSLQDALVVYFDGFLARLGVVQKDTAFPIDPDSFDWTAEVRLLSEILADVYVDLGELAFAQVADELAIELAFELEGPTTAPIRERLATQVSQITDTTRDILRDRVEVAVSRGYSVEQLVTGVDDLTGLRDLFGSRARTIALTETANAYNAAAIAGYVETGLVDLVVVFDGPDCGWLTHDDPDLAHNSERTLEEAGQHLISHPHCQRAFGALSAV